VSSLLDKDICDVHVRTEIVLTFSLYLMSSEMSHENVTASSSRLVPIKGHDEGVSTLCEEATDLG
jgi:hypothetical protein